MRCLPKPDIKKIRLKFVMSTHSRIQSAAREDEFWKEVRLKMKRILWIQLTRAVFSEQCLSQAKWMIALPWRNINRVKISQWFRELYSCRRLEKITHTLKGRDDSKRVGFIYIKHMDESDTLSWDLFNKPCFVVMILYSLTIQLWEQLHVHKYWSLRKQRKSRAVFPSDTNISHLLTLAYINTGEFFCPNMRQLLAECFSPHCIYTHIVNWEEIRGNKTLSLGRLLI